MKPVFVLNGANLGRLGRRQPEIYGTTTHDELAHRLRSFGAERGLAVEVRQTDIEGELISWLGEAADTGTAVVLNPAAWSHYSVAVADAVAQVETVIEVHISNIHAREEFRNHSLTARYATAVIAGLGLRGYELALEYLA